MAQQQLERRAQLRERAAALHWRAIGRHCRLRGARGVQLLPCGARVCTQPERHQDSGAESAGAGTAVLLFACFCTAHAMLFAQVITCDAFFKGSNSTLQALRQTNGLLQN